MRIWYAITVATQSHQLRRDVYKFLRETADDAERKFFLSFTISARAACRLRRRRRSAARRIWSIFSARIRWRRCFCTANLLTRRWRDFRFRRRSIRRLRAWGRETEIEAYRNMEKHFAKPIHSSPFFRIRVRYLQCGRKDLGQAVEREVIDSGATIVIRPDSGEPVEVVSRVAQILGEKFGTTTNSKGYKVLKNVRIIQGDGVNQNSIRQILQRLKTEGFSASNIAFGIGGSLLQKIDRDTLRFAYKCSAIVTGGEWREVYKQPITDSGKNSKRGRLRSGI